MGTALAMAVHAAGESEGTPAEPGTIAVVLAVANEDELLSLFAEIDAGSEHMPHLIREPDPPWNGQAMSFGFLTPHGKSRAVKHLRLWKVKSNAK